MNTQLIYEYMKQHNLSKTAFAKICGISLCKLNNVLAYKKRIKATTLVKIVKVLGVRAKDLIGF